MNSMLKMDIILPPVINQEGDIIKEEKAVKGFINLDEVLDYFRDDVIEETTGYARLVMQEELEREITVVTYLNGEVRYCLIPLDMFNSIFQKYRTFIDKNIIKSKFN